MKCADCDGAGELEHIKAGYYAGGSYFDIYVEICPSCNGTGDDGWLDPLE